jgi:hypothetical protein
MSRARVIGYPQVNYAQSPSALRARGASIADDGAMLTVPIVSTLLPAVVLALIFSAF